MLIDWYLSWFYCWSKILDWFLLISVCYKEMWLMMQNSVTVYTPCDEYLWNVLFNVNKNVISQYCMTLLIESWISRGLKQCYWLMYGSSALPLVSQEYSYYHWRDAPLKLDGKAVKQCTQQLQCFWPFVAVQWQHADPSQEQYHPSVLWHLCFGSRKDI